MSNKKKSSKNSIEKKKLENQPIPEWRRENMEFFMSALGKATIPSMEKTGDDMLDFVLSDEEILHLDEFYLRKGLTYDTFHGWLEKSAYLRAKYKLCMEIIGLRRQKVLRKTNPHTLTQTLYQHSPGWDKSEKRNADMKNKDDKNRSVEELIQAVKEMGISDKMPETDEVKEKK